MPSALDHASLKSVAFFMMYGKILSSRPAIIVDFLDLVVSQSGITFSFCYFVRSRFSVSLPSGGTVSSRPESLEFMYFCGTS
jgi:hypothetical protein